MRTDRQTGTVSSGIHRYPSNISLILRVLHGVWVRLVDEVLELLVGSIFT